MSAETPRKGVAVYILSTLGITFITSILNVILLEGSVASGMLLLVPGIACSRWWKRNAAVTTEDIVKVSVLAGVALFMLGSLFTTLMYPGIFAAYADYAGAQAGAIWGLRALASNLLDTAIVPLACIIGCCFGIYASVKQVKDRMATA